MHNVLLHDSLTAALAYLVDTAATCRGLRCEELTCPGQSPPSLLSCQSLPGSTAQADLGTATAGFATCPGRQAEWSAARDLKLAFESDGAPSRASRLVRTAKDQDMLLSHIAASPGRSDARSSVSLLGAGDACTHPITTQTSAWASWQPPRSHKRLLLLQGIII